MLAAINGRMLGTASRYNRIILLRTSHEWLRNLGKASPKLYAYGTGCQVTALNTNPGASTSTPRIHTIFPSNSTTGQFFRAAPATCRRSRTSATFLGPRLYRRVTRSPAFQFLNVAGIGVADGAAVLSARSQTSYSGACTSPGSRN